MLVAALMAVMILLALGYFILNTTTQDIRISGRLVGERKAFSAAESGVHALCRDLNPLSPQVISGFVDATNDPTVKYTTTLPVRSESMPIISLPGFDLTKSYTGAVFDTVVTGEDTAYGSKVQIAVGTASAPNPSDTQQGYN